MKLYIIYYILYIIYYSIATRIPPSQTKMTGWLEDCRTGGLEGWGVLKGQTWFTNFGFEAKLNFLYWVRFLEDMRASRGSAAFRSLCGDCGTFDARIGEGMGWNGIGWHVQSMFINDDQCWTMLISVGQRWSMLVNVDGVDQCPWVVTSVDQCWSMLINVGHWRSILINVGQCWSMLTNIMLLRTAKSLENHRSFVDFQSFWRMWGLESDENR